MPKTAPKPPNSSASVLKTSSHKRRRWKRAKHWFCWIPGKRWTKMVSEVPKMIVLWNFATKSRLKASLAVWRNLLPYILGGLQPGSPSRRAAPVTTYIFKLRLELAAVRAPRCTSRASTATENARSTELTLLLYMHTALSIFFSQRVSRPRPFKRECCMWRVASMRQQRGQEICWEEPNQPNYRTVVYPPRWRHHAQSTMVKPFATALIKLRKVPTNCCPLY